MTIAQHPRRPFADHVADYALAGWPCIVPVPPDEKHPPPIGFTGAGGRDTTPEQLVAWAGSHPAHAIAIRMPDGVIGIDVDQYVKKGTQKRGAETLAACEAKWGPLPPTWSSTARGDDTGPGVSRIMLFRVPAQRYATKLSGQQADGTVTGDVEVIQRHHRYAVVWPSPHADGPDGTGGTYRWYDPAGRPSDRVPMPGELTELPAAWVAGLAEGAAALSPAASDSASGQALLDQLLDDWRPECAEITSARLTAVEEIGRAEAGSRHDTMTARIYQLMQLASAGHTGVASAVTELRTLWETLTAGEDRTDEFERMLLTSTRKAVTARGPVQVAGDPCMLAGGFLIQAPAPGHHQGTGSPQVLGSRGGGADAPGGGDELPPVEPMRWFFPMEVMGTHAFDPIAMLDQPLAQAVLERTYPLARYAYDAKAWLVRGPERWDVRGNDLTSWLVSQVAWLMPRGNPEADKGTPEHVRHVRHGRFHTAGPSKAIAAKMQALVAGGTHPSTLRVGELDAEPTVLWAGGLAYDLRRCAADAPVAGWVSALDPATPHMHAAGVAPDPAGAEAHTPLWDAFLTAVWPDAEVRRWALRVLGIALTGYSDRALPILLGEAGRGKTQVVTLLMSVLGSYAYSADARLLSNRSEALATGSIVHDLKGRRLAFIDEGPRDSREGQEKLKWLTGGGDMSADAKYQNAVTWRPTHTLVLTTNEPPVLTDPAVRSRTRLIPCDGDPELVRTARAAIGHVNSPAWRAEAPGVLAKMMAEAAAWLADPSSALQSAAPEDIRFSAEIIAAEQDPITRWLEDETEPYEPGTPSRELYAAFVGSCLHANMRRDIIPSETKWGRELTRRGYSSQHTRRGKVRQLRIRLAGGFPEPLLPTQPAQQASGDGSNAIRDGFSETRHSEFSQVNPSSVTGSDGLNSSNTSFAHAPAPAPAHTQGASPAQSSNPSFPSREPAASASSSASSSAVTKPKREQSPEAKEAAAAARAEKRATAIAEAVTAAGGPLHDLPALVLRDGSVTSVQVHEAAALLDTITGALTPGANVTGELTVDVENTGYPIGHRHYALRTVQLGNENLALVLDPTDAAQREQITIHVAAARVLYAHSATADLIPLEVDGLLAGGIEEAWSRMHDTVTLAKLADPGSTKSAEGLKQLAPAVLGEAAVSPGAEEARSALFKAGRWLTETKPTTELERSGWAQVNPRAETMIRYAASDVLDDAAIARRLPYPEPHVWRREVLAQTMTARVAHTGLALDAEQVTRLQAEQRAALADAGARLGSFGVENPGSDAQVAAALEPRLLEAGLPALPRTPRGKPSVAKAGLNQYAALPGDLGELVRARLDYQTAENRLGLFLDGWHDAVTHGDGRVRPTVYTLEAKTGRMSCVRPNLQQVPRAGGFRACITADPGHVLISADFAQVELRVAAALSRDRDLIAILDDPNRDIHREIAQIVWGPAAGKAERYQAKRKVFGRIYGSGINGLVTADPPVSEPIARAIVAAMDHMTPGLTAWSRRTADQVEAGLRTYQAHSGRIIHMPAGRAYAAPNYCIQGEARELLIDALERWATTRWGRCPVLPVHDEIVSMVPEDDAEEATAVLVECMATVLDGVRIVAEASEPSRYWRDSE